MHYCYNHVWIASVVCSILNNTPCLVGCRVRTLACLADLAMPAFSNRSCWIMDTWRGNGECGRRLKVFDVVVFYFYFGLGDKRGRRKIEVELSIFQVFRCFRLHLRCLSIFCYNVFLGIFLLFSWVFNLLTKCYFYGVGIRVRLLSFLGYVGISLMRNIYHILDG